MSGLFHRGIKPTSTYRLDRRELMRYSAGAAIGAQLFSAKVLFAQDVCASVGSVATNTGASKVSDDNLYFWIDGLHFDAFSDIPSQANLALFMSVQQTEGRYVEQVSLTDESLNTIGILEFDANDKLSSGHVPYAMFNNVRLTYNKKYYVFYHIREGSDVVLKKFTLQNAPRSKLNADFLPVDMVNDFARFMGALEGLTTTPYQFYTENGLDLHSARAHIQDIGSDDSFSVNVELMHGDSSDTHYMRYFILADPVGRILGVKKRAHNQPIDVAIANTSGAMNVQALTEAERQAWKIAPEHVAKISDCPYIQVFTEDVFDALAKSTLHLV